MCRVSFTHFCVCFTMKKCIISRWMYKNITEPIISSLDEKLHILLASFRFITLDRLSAIKSLSSKGLKLLSSALLCQVWEIQFASGDKGRMLLKLDEILNWAKQLLWWQSEEKTIMNLLSFMEHITSLPAAWERSRMGTIRVWTSKRSKRLYSTGSNYVFSCHFFNARTKLN